MNTDLLDKNFAVGYPEELDGQLDMANGHANVCKFNRIGTLVAVGSNDGRIFLFDFVTRGLIKSWTAHVKPIASLDFSRNGRMLLSGSAESAVALWNVVDTNGHVDRFHFGTCVTATYAHFNPRDENQFLVLIFGTQTSSSVCSCILRDISKKEEVRLGAQLPSQDDALSAATFDKRGQFVMLGTIKGRVLMYCTKTKKLLKTLAQPVNHMIRNFIVTRRNGFVMTNSYDRIVRCYRLEDFKNASDGQVIEPLQKFQDMVNKISWKLICASNEGDYVCGASAKSHSLHIWERNSGNLIKILHGPKGELLTDVQWHPSRSIILSVANGVVSIWTQAHVENWSAFAPDFVELDDNRKYVETEFEFDVEDEDASEETKDRLDEDEEAEIDVTGLDPADIGSSDEDVNDDGTLWFLPVTKEIEQFEDEKPHV
ncbi:unnamed protein product [Bursaphelenchus okinawaensis]|uniref:WD_REPEATS_REGION domain-containing protein n=1 Tax=Bursaphelenchus okinawaensis TaxID=465554 RepID=A0A811KAC3_9BILA|nr:unnamed protein product [Bursaphelenchus okinawaensis]CAG9097280.1 unnamed protein product [Bursaphelenchus okinawaensis]